MGKRARTEAQSSQKTAKKIASHSSMNGADSAGGTTASHQTSDDVTKLLDWLKRDHGCDVDSFPVEVRTTADGQRGLFAKRDIHAHEQLVSIPASALLNQRTLRKHYGEIEICKTLSSLQLVMLHCARWKQGLEESPWAPFLETVPPTYDTVPLQHLQDERWKEMLSMAPYGVQLHQRLTEARFEKDWKACREADSRISLNVYLWAWLSFNTRCAHYKLGHADSNDNATLMPIIDMANHIANQTCKSIVNWRGDFRLFSCAEEASYEPDTVLLRAGQEAFATYGAHSNTILLVDYGFVADEYPYDELQVDDLFWRLLVQQRAKEADHLRDLLRQYDYEGCHYTAMVDYRLQVALALIASRSSEEWERIANGTDDLDPAVHVADMSERLKDMMREEARSKLQALRAFPAEGSLLTVRRYLEQMWQQMEDAATSVRVS